MLVDDNKKEKNEIEKEKEENDEEENMQPVELTDEELSLKKFDDSIKQGFKYGEELDEEYKLKQEQKEIPEASEEETYNDINMLIIKTEVKANLNMKIFKLDCDLSTLKLEEKILDQEIEFKKKLLKIKQTHIKNLQEQKGDYEDYINL